MDGFNRPAQAAGDFWWAMGLLVAQFDNLARLGRERLHASREMLKLFIGKPRFRRVVRGKGLDHVGGKPLRHWRALFNGLEHLVTGNCPGPRAEVRSALETARF